MTADPPSTAGPPDRGPAVDLFLLTAHGPAATVEYAVAAEAAGFAGVWLAEHHFIGYGTCPSATVLAGMVLGRTSRLTVGTAACVLSNRHPVALGEEAALLDAAGGGRFRLGVARGGPWVDLEVFGTGLDRFEHGFAESLDLLLRWLSGSARVGATGPRFAFREVDVVPRPPARMPVWVAATGAATVDLAAARGLPLLLGVHADDTERAALTARWAATAAAHGHDPAAAEHAAVHLVGLADTAADAERALRASMPAWLATTRGYVRIDGSAPGHRDLDAYLDRLLRIHPLGPAADCAAALAVSARATGARRHLLMVEAAGDRDSTLDAIARLGAELLPRLAC